MTLTIHRDLLQGSDEWLEARRGLLTASTIGALITPSTKAVANNDKARGLIAQIVAERLTDWHDPEFNGNWDMERGHMVEPIARDWYCQRYHVEVEQVGFMVLDLGDGVQIGYSPDGLVGDDGLIEIKAPRAKKHVLTHVDGKVPAEHLAQLQTGMYVSGRSWCDFISYVGGEAPFVTRIKADPDWFEAIQKAARHFETKAVEMAEKYRTATAGLPSTDRLPDPYDIELRLA